MSDTQHAWIIRHYAQGELQGTELDWVERPVPELAAGQVLIRTLLLTLDPSNRIWLSEERDYLPQLQVGDVMRGLVLGRVEQSRRLVAPGRVFPGLAARWRQVRVRTDLPGCCPK